MLNANLIQHLIILCHSDGADKYLLEIISRARIFIISQQLTAASGGGSDDEKREQNFVPISCLSISDDFSPRSYTSHSENCGF